MPGPLPTPAERLRQLARVLGQGYAGPLSRVWLAMLEAGAGDPEIADWCDEHERRRRQTAEELLDLALGRPLQPATYDAIWAISSIEIYLKLTEQRGWSPKPGRIGSPTPGND